MQRSLPSQINIMDQKQIIICYASSSFISQPASPQALSRFFSSVVLHFKRPFFLLGGGGDRESKSLQGIGIDLIGSRRNVGSFLESDGMRCKVAIKHFVER